MADFGSQPARLRDLLGETGRALGVDAPVETGLIFQRWSRLVGSAIAAHVEPTSLKQGVLRVRADTPAWANEVRYLATGIVQRVNEDLGKELVREMRVWVAAGAGERDAAQETASPEPEAPPAEPASTPAEAFQRARSAWARRRSRRSS